MADKKGAACPRQPTRGRRLNDIIDAPARRLPAAAAAAGTLPARTAAPGRPAVWSVAHSSGRVPVWGDVRRGGRRRGRHVRAAALRAAAAPPDTRPEPAVASDVQPRGGDVRGGGGRLSGLHRVPGAVLPILPDRGSTAIHTAAASNHHDTKRVRGGRSVRGSGADAAAARAARRAALARAPRRAAAAPSAVALS